MENTQNYNLKKPAPEDFYDVADQNDNMDSIDAALKAHDDALTKKANLDETGKVPAEQLPAFSTLELGETDSTAYRGDRGKQAYEHSMDGTKHITAAERDKLAGLENYDLTSVDAHMTDTVRHVTQTERNAWGGMAADILALQNGKLDVTHSSEAAATETGVHGFRYYKDHLQYLSGGNWQDIEKPVTFGIRIDTTNSNPESAVVYTDDAVGMEPGSGLWDEKEIFKDIKPCLLKDGVVRYYLNPEDFTQKADGSAATIDDAEAGDVMIEVPKVGFKISTVGNYMDVKITNGIYRADEGYRYYAHTREKEGDREKLYIGAYLGYLSDLKLCSLSGKIPSSDFTLGNAISYARNRGNGYDILGFYPLTLVQCLYLIKYKNLDSQSAFGAGYTSGPYLQVTETGQTNVRGMFYGTSDGSVQSKLFGLEDFWGNLLQWIGGFTSDSEFNLLTAYQNFNDNGNGYLNRGNASLNASIGGFLSKVQGTSERGFISQKTGGSETTYYADVAPLQREHFPRFGGHIGGYAGSGIFSIRTDALNTLHESITGSRLMYL